MAGRRKTEGDGPGKAVPRKGETGLRPSAFDLRNTGNEEPKNARQDDVAAPLPKAEEDKPAATGRMKGRRGGRAISPPLSDSREPDVAPAPEGRTPKAEGRKKVEGRKKSAGRKNAKGPTDKVVEELQNVGADVVPSVAIEAIREHTIDQVQPESEQGTSVLTDWDLYLFNEGSHHKLWEKLGSHITKRDGVVGTNFGVWAPNAESVSVIGDFNGWNPASHRLEPRGHSGIWERWIPHVSKGTIYKYHIVSRHNGFRVDKADPFAVHHETPPRTGSIVWDLDYEWNDAEWMANRRSKNGIDSPMSIYELHLGSWRHANEDGRPRMMSYREVAEPLAHYVRKMNYTHVELMPIMEHPFGGSWGYQCTGFFAPTSRHGTPQDFKYLVDVLHQNGIGVILDWVPSHFPTDEHGLAYFDGTHLFEHADPRKGFHPDWGSLIFNYGRNEVRSFLLSSALYWLGEYHADGLRVDAVASMLYLDYSRKHGEWIPNEFGGRENIEAISFLRRLNEDVYKVHPDVQVIAEESTAWPMVSRPTYVGGLGFGMKWDMGWMHDTLRYFANEPIHRKYHHNDLTFRMMYAFTENFVLPLSHDEVVHGKGSLIGKMPGDEWQKFANLRLLYAHMYSQPGKKLMFMGGEIGQYREWNHDMSVDWHLLDYLPHSTLQRWVEDLNRTYRDVPALHEVDVSPDGFEWIDCCDNEQSIVSLLRRSRSNPEEEVVVVLNFTPVPRHNYQIGVPRGGHWKEILNSDAPLYGGSGQGNLGGVDAAPIPLHGRKWSVNLTLPPLGAVFLVNERE
jgi:1,4-alpha-glucan branching enzyme